MIHSHVPQLSDQFGLGGSGVAVHRDRSFTLANILQQVGIRHLVHCALVVKEEIVFIYHSFA